MLIVDGHSSHLSYQFCALAERLKICILCLPPHTTHALQPCDVGLFGPIASAWKTKVSKMAREHEAVTKWNILAIYGQLRLCVVLLYTVLRSFEKCGIHPYNMSIIPESSYEPSLATTVASAQPIPAACSTLLQPIEAANSRPGQSLDNAVSESASSIRIPVFRSTLAGVPPTRRYALKAQLVAENTQLRMVLGQAQQQIEADHAQKCLMEAENGRLRMKAFKKSEKRWKNEVFKGPRHMTGDDALNELAERYVKDQFKEVHREMKPRLKGILADMKASKAAEEREARAMEKALEQEQLSAKKAAEKAKADEQRAQKAAEREEARKRQAGEKARKAADRKAVQLRREEEKQRKEVAKARRNEEKAMRDQEKADKAEEMARRKVERAAMARKRKRTMSDDDEPGTRSKQRHRSFSLSDEETEARAVSESAQTAVPRARPRPRPRFKVAYTEGPIATETSQSERQASPVGPGIDTSSLNDVIMGDNGGSSGD